MAITGFMIQHSFVLQTLPITPASWIPLALVAVLTVIFVAAFVYMLSGIINSQHAKAWARFQIYEALLSILLLLAFSSIIYIFYLNPQAVFGAVNLVPQPQGSVAGCTGATELYTLATCDVAEFNSATYSIVTYSFFVTYITAFVSGFGVNFTIAPVQIIPGIKFEVTVPQLFPGGISLLDIVDEVALFMLIFNQIQLFLLSGSLFFLGFFVSLGLIARTFGFTRTFGGAMIAFGLGLGIVYPLLVAITYGYIDVAAGVTCIQVFSCFGSNFASSIWSLLLNTFSLSGAGAGTVLGNVFISSGYIIAGLTIVPLINIAIVDAFIIDFSSAIGERMSFGELFSNLI